MAKFEDRDISEFPQHNNGSLRVYKWKGKVCIATIAQKRRRTTTQKETIQKIGLLNHFNSTVYAFINIGLASSGSRPSARVFKLNYRSAFKGEYPNIELDYPSLSLSEGPLVPPQQIVTHLENNKLTVSWSPQSANSSNNDSVTIPDHSSSSPDDYLILALYNPSTEETVMSLNEFTRKDGTAIISIPKSWKSDNPFIAYLAFHNGNPSAPLSSPTAAILTSSLPCGGRCRRL